MKKTFTITLLIIFLLLVYLIFKPNTKDDIEGFKENIAPLTITLSSQDLKQGEYIKVIFDNVTNQDLKITNNIAPPINNEIYFHNDKAYAFIPIPLTTRVGSYEIIIFEDSVLLQKYDITIVEDDFEVQNLTISEDTLKKTQTEEARQLYREAMKKARSYNLGIRFYEDKFIMPTLGRLTTGFGVKRYVNNSTTPSHHHGIDIANETGTPIKTPASGMVTYAGFFPSGGNYIVIDHGMGLFTYYAHLDSFAVEELAIVKQGDIIGYMGTTGFSTGPHLHFAISLKEIFINPWLFVNREELED